MGKVAKPYNPLDNGNRGLEGSVAFAGPGLMHHSVQCPLILHRDGVGGKDPPRASCLFSFDADLSSDGLTFTASQMSFSEIARLIPPGLSSTRRLGLAAGLFGAVLIGYLLSSRRPTWRSTVSLNPHVPSPSHCKEICSPDLAMTRDSPALKSDRLPDH
jgi:hypothetical protein